MTLLAGLRTRRFERRHWWDYDDESCRWVRKPKGRVAWRALPGRYRSLRAGGVTRLGASADCLYVRYWWEPLMNWAYNREVARRGDAD